MNNMKHTCTNVSVRIPYSVYKDLIKYVLDNEWEHTQKVHERKDMQYIRVLSGSVTSEYYLQMYEVIYHSGTKTECYLSVNVAPLKPGENHTYHSHIQELQDGKEAIESILDDAGLPNIYKLIDLRIGLASVDKPYIWED